MRVAIICKKYSYPVNYINWLKLAGIEPIVVFKLSNLDKLSTADGILFSGGGDIKPYFFGKKNIGNDFDLYRDILELLAFKQNKDKVMLGICRGAQTINVFCGGTVKDIDSSHFKVFHFLGKEKVFSFHHQAIDVLAPEFCIKHNIGNIIEEAHGKNKILVQFHPEKTCNARILFLFKHFLKIQDIE